MNVLVMHCTTEGYFESFQINMMKLCCTRQLFRKKALPEMFDNVLNMPLHNTVHFSLRFHDYFFPASS